MAGLRQARLNPLVDGLKTVPGEWPGTVWHIGPKSQELHKTQWLSLLSFDACVTPASRVPINITTAPWEGASSLAA
jgi:hypothetical protein